MSGARRHAREGGPSGPDGAGRRRLVESTTAGGGPDGTSEGLSMQPTCRFCDAPLRHTFVDLGTSPLCQSHVRPEDFARPEPTWPLHARVCERCFLVQIEHGVAPSEIFGGGDYAYFSSYSDSWLAHARDYCDAMVERFALDSSSRVVEVASNDGYLLQNFVARAIPVLGIEPASNCAEAARERGIETIVEFFGRELAAKVRNERGPADLLLGNNVLAHVPDINDFVAGLSTLLASDGILTLEFPHLMRLVESNQFDTIYHEHYSYLRLATVDRILERHGLRLFDVEELATHGGSLRVHACPASSPTPAVAGSVAELLDRETKCGMDTLDYYTRFAEQVAETKRGLLEFLIREKRAGRQIVGYGAPGKGNTLLNYCGIRTDFLDYTVDRSPHKQGNFLPGSRIPIHAPERIFETRPDFVLILPWNLRDEIVEQMAGIRDWGGRFVVPIPRVEVLE